MLAAIASARKKHSTYRGFRTTSSANSHPKFGDACCPVLGISPLAQLPYKESILDACPEFGKGNLAGGQHHQTLKTVVYEEISIVGPVGGGLNWSSSSSG
jgi:hypothetical protein